MQSTLILKRKYHSHPEQPCQKSSRERQESLTIVIESDFYEETDMLVHNRDHMECRSLE